MNVDLPVSRAPKIATFVCAFNISATSRAKSSMPTIFVRSTSGRSHTKGFMAIHQF